MDQRVQVSVSQNNTKIAREIEKSNCRLVSSLFADLCVLASLR